MVSSSKHRVWPNGSPENSRRSYRLGGRWRPVTHWEAIWPWPKEQPKRPWSLIHLLEYRCWLRKSRYADWRIVSGGKKVFFELDFRNKATCDAGAFRKLVLSPSARYARVTAIG